MDDKLDAHLRPKESPYNTRVNFTPAFDFDTTYEVQGKKLKSSQIQTNNFVSGTITGTIITAGNINAGDITGTSTITAGTINSTETNAAAVVSSSVLGTILITPNGITVESGTANGTLVSLINTAGTPTFQVSLESDFAKMKINEIDFSSNTSNKFIESFGPTAQLADAVGVHALRVKNSGGAEMFKVTSDNIVQIQGIPSGSGTPSADAVSLWVDAGGGGGKHRLMCQFQSGTAIPLATEP